MPTYTHEYQRCIPVNLRLTKNLLPENSLGSSEKLDQNKIRLRAVAGSSNRTSFSGMILKKDDFNSFDDVTCKLVEIHNISRNTHLKIALPGGCLFEGAVYFKEALMKNTENIDM